MRFTFYSFSSCILDLNGKRVLIKRNSKVRYKVAHNLICAVRKHVIRQRRLELPVQVGVPSKCVPILIVIPFLEKIVFGSRHTTLF